VFKNKVLRYFSVVCCTINLNTLRILVSKGSRSARNYLSNSYRLYKYCGDSAGIPTISIYDLLPNASEASITLCPKRSEGLAVEIEELAFLGLITVCIQPLVVFEIGTYKGRTALNFAVNSSENCVVYTMDLPRANMDTSTLGPGDTRVAKSSQPGLEYGGHRAAIKIKQLFANSLDFDFSGYYGCCDIVFIDGGHSFECVSSDTQNALKMVKPGGGNYLA
jgi:hypothetical protein